MSEGKWESAKYKDIKEGDVVRVVRKSGPQTTITEGRVTLREGVGETFWTIEDYENFYLYEFVPDEDGDASTLEKFVPPFQWPTKLGAIVKGTDEGGETVHAVLVRNLSQTLWWTAEWGVTTADDLSDLDDLTVVAEGATVVA